MLINEIFFFLFGTILISFVYKYKLRLDYIIIGIILNIFALKVVLSIVYFYKKSQMYTTTDYYFFDFGIYFLNPLYNLSYFLIGMFFGLINYSIQKGITDIYEDNNYKKYILLKDPKFYNEKDSHSDISTNLNINLIKNNDDNSSLSINEENEDDINDKNKDNKNKIEINSESDRDNVKKYNEQIEDMPFLILPIKFFNFNKRVKSSPFYYIIIVLSFLIILFLSISKPTFSYIFSKLNKNSEDKEYIK